MSDKTTTPNTGDAAIAAVAANASIIGPWGIFFVS